MKKIFALVCTAAMLCMMGCTKEKQQDNNDATNGSNNGGGTPPPTVVEKEGLYNPAMRITNIVYGDNTPAERWEWGSTQLQSVKENDGSVLMSFGYDATGRVNSIERNISEWGGTLGVYYSGDYVDRITLEQGGESVVEALVQHNNNHQVSGASLDLSDSYLLDIFNSALEEYIGNDSAENLPAPTIDNAQASIAFDWAGRNVSASRMNVAFQATVSLGTIKQYILPFLSGTDSLMLAAFPDRTPITFHVTMNDTASYIYDDKVNPFRHYMGKLFDLANLDVEMLSANNVREKNHTGALSLEISVSILTLPAYSYSLPDRSKSFTYRYNDGNYPTSVTDQDEVITTYVYQE